MGVTIISQPAIYQLPTTYFTYPLFLSDRTEEATDSLCGITESFTSHAQTAFKRSACNLGAFFEDTPSRLGALSNNAASSCHAVSQSFTSLLARRNCRSPCRTNRLRSVFDRLINNIFCCPVDLRLVNSRNREGPEVLAQALGAWLE